jgi:hypothetical protein
VGASPGVQRPGGVVLACRIEPDERGSGLEQLVALPPYVGRVAVDRPIDEAKPARMPLPFMPGLQAVT